MTTDKKILIIREAQPDDVASLADIYLDSAKYHFDLDQDLYKIPSRKFVLDWFIQLIDRLIYRSDSGIIFVAEISDEVIGYVCADKLSFPEESSMIQGVRSIDIGISVVENNRRHGVGTALMRKMEIWAREQGFSRMTLNANIRNDGAIRFYREQHGFRPIGIVMEKSLHS